MALNMLLDYCRKFAQWKLARTRQRAIIHVVALLFMCTRELTCNYTYGSTTFHVT